SAGWRLSKERFLESNESIQDLKIRVSYGESGNNNIGDYSSVAVLSSADYSWGDAIASGWAPGNIINPDLTWEKSRTFDVGLDFTLFNSRLSGSIDVYNRISSNLLLNVPTMLSTGFSSLLDNAGEVQSRGWDLELTTRNIQRDDFTWSTSLNLSYNTNKVTKLIGDQKEILIPSSFDIQHSILRVGEP